ncbi:intracellular protein transport protein [Drechmeria coniospora]|uniref:Intracellular protein transport protein n=1 Tax=Drechmeria coniospora TaxID=98403 RepID=A0A151GVQ1_DRECN|nr:intracellular protein transport protein [Drechmeria coniospora]KYK61195.1 intracellular protein transport protein [Drechmeria coniospora]
MAPDPTSGSNIRVFVHWNDDTVFAGEDVGCTIIFKNVAPEPNQVPNGRRTAYGRAKAAADLSSTSPGTVRGHRRSALSLSMPSSNARSLSGSVQWPHPANSEDDWKDGHARRRSVSIVSIGSAGTSTTDDDHSHPQRGHETSTRPQRQPRGHSRAVSLQVVSKMHALSTSGNHSSATAARNITSPLFHTSYPADLQGRSQSVSETSKSPNLTVARNFSRTSPVSMPDFRFPAAPAPSNESQPTARKSTSVGSLLSARPASQDHNHLSIRTKDLVHSPKDRPAARILSSTSASGGTPRSSGEFYSVSNNSSETLASEHVSHPLIRSQGRAPQLRRSLGVPPQQPKMPESLMMGYAQIQGSFTLDSSLVGLGAFEQVKKKATVGGRGGGVVGLEPTRRDSGLFRSFGWGNISNSLGGLLGGGELSTIQEMRGAANSKNVPLLSTPQSILFVDLQLAPGESRVFEYTFKLPKGLPPSHKGKAVKISYGLVIGTQRAGGAKEQQLHSVEIPFRVLGSINSRGEILGHDLMSPYILMRDEARVVCLGKNKTAAHGHEDGCDTPTTVNEFLTYVDELAMRPRDDGGALMSPTDGRRPTMLREAMTANEAIHLAIMRSNLAGEGQQSPNRFEIARNGRRVGTVMLTRPAYRLGEVVTMVMDFTDADIPCYSVHATLETSEKIDPSLAIRTDSSIHRVTRRIYSTSSESALYSRRIVFTPTIPIAATPEFVTSGVSLEWKIRVEFVVPFQGDRAGSPGGSRLAHPLLEQMSQDEKGGLVLVGVENLACESFDVSVPLRVYGAVGRGLERLELDEASEEGLAV